MNPNSKSLAFVFPGQGSQAVGMGRELAASYKVAADVFAEVDEALGQNLSELMFEGSLEDLTLTENAQPALMAVSIAVVRVLAENGFDVVERARFVAGHSLGEYSALIAAGTFSLADGTRLLKTRGQAMQQAVPVGEGAMAALLGLDMETAKVVAGEAAESEICTAANDNAPGQVVISGARRAVERAIEIAKAHGAKRGMLLPVSAPFHCALMAPAAQIMADALAVVKMESPKVPLIANITAEVVNHVPEIRRLLVEQVTGMVRWRESVQYMRDEGVGKLIEVGSGKVLSCLARRIDREMEAVSIGAPEDIAAFLEGIENV